MRIGTKLTLLLLLAVAVVMAGFGYLRAQQVRQRVLEEFRQEILVLANAIKLTVEHALRDRKPQDIRELLIEMVRDPNPVDRIRIYDRHLVEISSASSEPVAPTAVPRPELEQVLRTREAVVRYLETPTRPAVYAVVPLKTRGGAAAGVLEVVHAATRVQRQIQDATWEHVWRLTLLSLTIALVIWVTVRVSIRRPITQLVRAALAFGRGDLSRRLDLKGRDEIGQLASAFNRMAEELQAAQAQLLREGQARLELDRQVQQAEKLAAVGRLASEVAHEIGTPLNIISGRAEAIQKALPANHPLSRHVATILRQIERIGGIIRQILEHARPRRPTPRPVAVAPILIRTVELLEPQARKRQVTVQAEASEELPRLLADPDQLQQALLNLLNNALDATPPGGRIVVSASDGTLGDGDPRPRLTRGRAEGPHLTVGVADTGGGMTGEQLEQVFEPFFSTKERRGGTGLGLPIVEDIVRSHGGAIEVQSAAGAGTTVRLRWPVAPPAGRATPPGNATLHTDN